MKNDLRKDYKAVLKHIKQRVRDCPEYENIGPGEGEDPVSLITLGFAFDQSGWIALVFDTRPDAESDGHWQFHIEDNEVDFQHWFDAVDPIHEAAAFGRDAEPLTITKTDGSTTTFESYDVEAIVEVIGKMLWQALCEALDTGLLQNYHWPIAA